MELTPKQLESLRLACDAFIPSLERPAGALGDEAFWRRKASDLEVAEQIPAIFDVLTARERKELRQLLDLLGSPLLGLTWGGPWKPLANLSFERRERLFQRWSVSRLLSLRRSFQALKKLSCFIFYSRVVEGRNPGWEALGYPGPLEEAPLAEPPLQVLRPASELELRCDVVVVGSGAGGGLAAGLLAEAGQEVVLVDKGPYVPEMEMSGLEAEMIPRLYEAQGALASVDGGVTVFAGSCLGGGTTVNWAGAFETPEAILREWAEEHDLPHLLTDAYRQSSQAVVESVGVTREESPDNPQNAALRRGSEALGYDGVRVIPRNVRGCVDDGCRGCGYCTFGCRKGKKQSTLRTWIRRAAAAGATLLVDTEVSRVLVEGGAARGVEGVAVSPDGRRVPVRIRAQRVVVAAGSIHTPALLLRSGIRHPHLGRHLYLHPTVPVAGFYAQEMAPWWGVMMSAVSDQLAHLDGNYGCKLETPPVHTGLLGLATPWTSARQHKETMLQGRHSGNFIVLTRDRHAGRVTVDRDGRPEVRYRLHPYDLGHLLRGVEECVRIHLAAGAESAYVPHATFPRLATGDGQGALEDFCRGLGRLAWKPGTFQLFTAHQMGTCRMGGDRRTAPLSPEGELYGVRGLFVADASAFPAASGVNPMTSIQTLAHHTIRGLLSRL